MKWSFANPVQIRFGSGGLDTLSSEIGRSRYALITYPDAPFTGLAEQLTRLVGQPALLIDDVAPDPDYTLLRAQSARFAGLTSPVELIVAIGGGSVIDSAKVFAAAAGDFGKVQRVLESKEGADRLAPLPIVAVPTTAGTGSEVTRWATVWDKSAGKKYSLSLPNLYPRTAIVDPALTLGKPRQLTVSTGLDALSHALESIWNVNANPVSATFAVTAAGELLTNLPSLIDDPDNLALRTSIAKAALFAGLAFSNTKTAIAHNMSYPITLKWGVQHGIACSFTLPAILRSVAGIGGFREDSLRAIFGDDLEQGADDLARFLERLGVGTRFSDHGVFPDSYAEVVDEAFEGERGRNFAGSKERLVEAAVRQGAMTAAD